uniref:Uncharacterized protein n=1 Tax=Salix viminalis TaxID=40686 RepID=A0A6N2ND12_SALVM
MHKSTLRYVVSQCLSSIFSNILAKDQIGVEWLSKKKMIMKLKPILTVVLYAHMRLFGDVHLPSQHSIVYLGNESLLNVMKRPMLSTRTKGFSLGRLTYVHPAIGELYFLRLILSHVKGALCFDDLKKVSRILYPTFQLACKSLGLLGDNKERANALCEAINISTY